MAAVIEEDGEGYVPIGQRPEWADVQPRPLPVGDHPVVSIARDQQFGDLMDYFWAAVEAQVRGGEGTGGEGEGKMLCCVGRARPLVWGVEGRWKGWWC